MSLAHLQEMKAGRSPTSSGGAGVRRAGLAASYCGASHEPVFRTIDDATASGLELCDSCLVFFRRQKKAR
jgi:hypothetical protein